jgi:hypothetical protein
MRKEKENKNDKEYGETERKDWWKEGVMKGKSSELMINTCKSNGKYNGSGSERKQ